MLIAAPNVNVSERMYGDMLEAFIGAMYLDLGYQKTFTFVQKRIINSLLSLEDLSKNRNYKSQLLEWGQQYKKKVVFTEEKDDQDDRVFIAQVHIDSELIAEATGSTKKLSHNNVAHKAIILLKGNS